MIGPCRDVLDARMTRLWNDSSSRTRDAIRNLYILSELTNTATRKNNCTKPRSSIDFRSLIVLNFASAFMSWPETPPSFKTRLVGVFSCRRRIVTLELLSLRVFLCLFYCFWEPPRHDLSWIIPSSSPPRKIGDITHVKATGRSELPLWSSVILRKQAGRPPRVGVMGVTTVWLMWRGVWVWRIRSSKIATNT